MEEGVDSRLHGILDCLPDVVQCVSDIIPNRTPRSEAAGLGGARQSDEQQKHARKTLREIKSHFCIFPRRRGELSP